MKVIVDVAAVSLSGHKILQEQTLEFALGITSLIGRNGAGKTTLLRAIVGLGPRPAHCVIGDPKPRWDSRDPRRLFAHVGYLPQDVPPARTLTVREFVEQAAWLKRVPKQRRANRVNDALSMVGLAADSKKTLRQLSGGMRRRAGIAAALVHEPEFVVLDEPTAGLDPVERARMHTLITSIAEDRVLVLSTHLFEDLAAVGGAVAVMRSGVVHHLGLPGDARSDADTGRLLAELDGSP